MPIYKNVASQKVAVFAWDTANDVAKTGDAANITAQISLGGAATAATNDVNPTELDATDAPGVYLFDMTQAETNADLIVVAPVSATADITLEPLIIYTSPGSNAGITAADVTLADGAHGGSSTVITLDRIIGASTSGDCVSLTGEGSGEGLALSGGVTGDGLRINGGGTSGNGIQVVTTNGDGILVDASGSLQAALNLTSNDDIAIYAGGDIGGIYTETFSSGDAIYAEAAANGDAIALVSQGTGNDISLEGDGKITGTDPLGLEAILGTPVADVSTDIAGVQTDTTAILADTNELQTDDIPTLIAALPTAVENRTEMDSNSTQLAAIVEDTGTTVPATLTTIEGKIDTVDTNVDAILVDTATTIPATLTAQDAQLTFLQAFAGYWTTVSDTAAGTIVIKDSGGTTLRTITITTDGTERTLTGS